MQLWKWYEMLTRIGQLLKPTENVSAREIPLGVTKILPRHGEVLSGAMVATVAMAMVAMVAMVVVVVVVVVMVGQ